MALFGRKLSDAQRAEELFSPYIDGQVTAGERAFLEQFLATHPDARQKFERLKSAVQLTRALPPVKAPRSFVLPKSMARKPSVAMRLYPAMRLATVAAMALFVFALAGDLMTSSRLASVASAPDAVVSLKSVEATPTLETAQAAPLPLMVTATPEASANSAVTAGGASATAQPEATAALELSIAPTESPAPTEAAAAEQESLRLRESPTPTPTPEASETIAEPPAAPADALRIAVFALAGIALVLTAATLIVRQRI